MHMKGKKSCSTSEGKNVSQEVTTTSIFKRICSFVHAVLPNICEGSDVQTNIQLGGAKIR